MLHVQTFSKALGFYFSTFECISTDNRGVMVSMLALSVVDHGYKPRSGETSITLVFASLSTQCKDLESG
jgi:hypothetical protein